MDKTYYILYISSELYWLKQVFKPLLRLFCIIIFGKFFHKYLFHLIEDIGLDELTEESKERYYELIEDDVNSGYCEDESNACDWDLPISVTLI